MTVARGAILAFFVAILLQDACILGQMPSSPSPTPFPPGCAIQEICFAMDESGSIGAGNFNLMRDFVNDVADLIDSFNGMTEYSAVSFDGGQTIVQSPTMSLTDFKNAITTTVYNGGGTNINQGITGCIDQLTTVTTPTSSSPSRVLVLLSDGQGTATTDAQALANAMTAKANGVNIISVGIGSGVDDTFLTSLASPGFYTPINFPNLMSIVRDITLDTCAVVSSSPTPAPSVSSACELDHVCFSIDSSGSIERNEFRRMQKFVNRLAMYFASSSVMSTFSAVSFDHIVRTIIHPKKSLSNFTAEVDAIRYTGGGTDLAAGLKGCSNLLMPLSGERAIVFITDGKGNNKAAELAAKMAKNDGILISTVGIEEHVNKKLLQSMASKQKLFFETTFGLLPKDPMKISQVVCDSLKAATAAPPAVPESCKSATRLCKLRFEGVLKNPMKFVISGSQFTTPVVHLEDGKMVKFDSSDVKTTVIFKKKTVALPNKLFTAVRGKRKTVTFELNGSFPIKPSKYMNKCLRLDVVVDGGSIECAVFKIVSR